MSKSASQLSNSVTQSTWFHMFFSFSRKVYHYYLLLLLRLSLAFVFIWFGALKLVGASPVIDLINKTYPFLPEPLFCTILGAIEVLTGIGLLFHFTRSLALILLSGELVGIFFGWIMAPSVYFQNSNPFLLTTYGEFVFKNVVLLAAALVIYRDHRLAITSSINDMKDQVSSSFSSNTKFANSYAANMKKLNSTGSPSQVFKNPTTEPLKEGQGDGVVQENEVSSQ
jgi:putative oxidoreductase